jgi:hypothetical protein
LWQQQSGETNAPSAGDGFFGTAALQITALLLGKPNQKPGMEGAWDSMKQHGGGVEET